MLSLVKIVIVKVCKCVYIGVTSHKISYSFANCYCTYTVFSERVRGWVYLFVLF